MPLRINGTEVKYLRINGADVDKAYINGTEVYSGGPSTIGEFWEGGYYIGQLNGYYLLCSPDSGQQESIKWFNINLPFDTPGTYYLYDGYTNTQNMVNHQYDHPAAKFCWNLSINGYTDWYLPAKNELSMIWNSISQLTQNAGLNFNPNIKTYWSSTAHPDNKAAAYSHDLSSGYSGITAKYDPRTVRVIRRVAI